MKRGTERILTTHVGSLLRPPDARQPDNLWPEWPKVHKLDYGQEEATARECDRVLMGMTGLP